MSEIEILEKFKSQLVAFLDELNEIIPDDEHLITLRIFVNDQIPVTDLMKSFITSLYPHKDRVKNRDDKFFINKKDLFITIKPETVQKFKDLWRSNFFDSEDRKVIWAWADRFYKIGDEYVKCCNY
jgi:hypothetical protein